MESGGTLRTYQNLGPHRHTDRVGNVGRRLDRLAQAIIDRVPHDPHNLDPAIASGTPTSKAARPSSLACGSAGQPRRLWESIASPWSRLPPPIWPRAWSPIGPRFYRRPSGICRTGKYSGLTKLVRSRCSARTGLPMISNLLSKPLLGGVAFVDRPAETTSGMALTFCSS